MSKEKVQSKESEELTPEQIKDAEELAAAQEKQKAFVIKKPKLFVMKDNILHNGVFYEKGKVCPDSKIEEFTAKGFLEDF